MRRFLFFLTLAILLAGCAAATPDASIDTTPSTAPEPEAPTTLATEPPDPMELLLDAMTTEEKVGQLFLARCDAATAPEDIGTCHLGGFILFGQDFDNETPDSFRAKIQAYQAASPIPLLIAVDEEGGTVCRVSRNPAFRSSRFPSPRESYASGGLEQVLALETEKAQLLTDLGINVNMVRSVTSPPASVPSCMPGPWAKVRRRPVGSYPPRCRYTAITIWAVY